jgi:hypothetical protein
MRQRQRRGGRLSQWTSTSRLVVATVDYRFEAKAAVLERCALIVATD